MSTEKWIGLIAISMIAISALAMTQSTSIQKQPLATLFEFDNSTRIDANLVNMYVTNHGSFAYNINAGEPGLEYPTGTNMHAVFASGLWIGALINQQIHVTVAEYSTEYSPGFMVNAGPNPEFNRPHFRVYKIDENSGPGDPDWDEWPSEEGAPVDEYGDPLLIGDHTLWCVYNDADPLLHTNDAGLTPPLGVEIQQTMFAFDSVGALEYVIYMKFLIINKGSNYLQDAYVALWSDPDLGGAGDDYVGCDTTLWVGYCYNATNNDQIYGTTPPCIGYDLLQGPIVPSPGDTAIVSWQSYPDFRNLPMASFNKYINGIDPHSAQESYWYMLGLDAVEGEGEPYIDPTTGDTTTYVMAGDPVAGTGWLDGNPSDRRFMLSSGPFNMEPVSSHGDSIIIGITAQEIWAAIVVGHGTDRLNSITVMRNNDIAAQEFFEGNFLNVEPNINTSVPREYFLYQNYPNPFNSTTVLRFEIRQPGKITLTVHDILGHTIAVLINNDLSTGSYSIPWNAVDLPSGIYFCQLTCNNFHHIKKLVLLK